MIKITQRDKNIFTSGLVLLALFAVTVIAMAVTDNPPTVTATNPVSNSTVSGTINITASASDDNGIRRVDFSVDGVLIGSDATSPYENLWDTTNATEGGHTVTATAFDISILAMDTIEDVTFVAVDNNDDTVGFGVSTVVGDFNGDGLPDLGIGCDRCDTVNANSGKAYIFYGGIDGIDTTVDLTFVVPNNSPSDRFGWKVAAADFDNDGFDDFVVGCKNCDGISSNSGRAYVYSGGVAMDTTYDLLLNDPDDGIDDEFSSSLNVGNFNNDSYPDLAVGCQGCHNINVSGKAYIYFGSASGLALLPDKTFVSIDDNSGDRFGRSVDAGDINGDGFDDLLVGCKHCDNTTSQSGKAYIFYGGLGTTMDTVVDKTIPVPPADDIIDNGFGGKVAAGDFNDDGFADLIVGCEDCDIGATNATGKAYIFYGGTNMDTTVDLTFESPDGTALDLFGVSVRSGDFNRDGLDDLAVGAYGGDFGGVSMGKAYIFYGGAPMDTVSDLTFIALDQTAGDDFGWEVVVGDLNRDGVDDLIVSADRADTGSTGKGNGKKQGNPISGGKVYVFYGGLGSQTTSDSVNVIVDNEPDPPEDFTLTTTGYKVKGLHKADLEWVGAVSVNVDVYRDGTQIDTTANDGFYTDNIDNRGGATYTHQLCEEGTSVCTNETTISF